MADIWRTMWKSLGWLKFVVCATLIHLSFQNSDEGPEGNYTVIANYSMMLNMKFTYSQVYFMKPFPNRCACHDRQLKIYNLEPLQNIDGTPSFTVKSKKYPGYSYSYNPCSSFELGPNGGGCQKDVALCWYVPKGPPDTYKAIGNQAKARCQLDKETKAPILVYHSRDFQYRKATVKLLCDKSKKEKDDAIFEVLDEDEWIFQLTHLCACGDGCLINPADPTTPRSDITASPAPFDPMRVAIPVAVSAGTVVLLFVPILVCRLVRRQNANNNQDDERRPLVRDGPGPVDHVCNPIQECSSGQSQPLPVGSSGGKDDVNVQRSVDV